MTDLENPLKKPAPRELLLGYCLQYSECSVLVFSSSSAILVSFIFQHSLLIYSINNKKALRLYFFITFSPLLDNF